MLNVTGKASSASQAATAWNHVQQVVEEVCDAPCKSTLELVQNDILEALATDSWNELMSV